MLGHGTIMKISNEFDLYYYNENVRLMHYKVKDLFNLRTILESCESEKTIEEWKHAQEIDEIAGLTFDVTGNYEIELSSELYIPRELVPVTANWANPVKAFYIYKLFADIETDLIRDYEKLKTKMEDQKEYFYLIYKDFVQPDTGYTVLQGVRAKLYEHEQDRYPEKFKRRWLEIRPVEDPKMLHRKIKKLAQIRFSVKRYDSQKSYDIKFRDLQVTIRTELLNDYKEWLKEFFYNEGYSEKDFIE